MSHICFVPVPPWRTNYSPTQNIPEVVVVDSLWTMLHEHFHDTSNRFRRYRNATSPNKGVLGRLPCVCVHTSYHVCVWIQATMCVCAYEEIYIYIPTDQAYL